MIDYPIAYITPSGLRDYLSCPKLYYYRHVAKIKLPKTIALVFGGSVHDAIEGFYLGQDPQEIFKSKFTNVDLRLPEEEFTEHFDDGAAMIKEFVESQDYLKHVHGLSDKGASEEKFKLVLKDPVTRKTLELEVSGRYDRITDLDQILEYKTSKKKYKESKFMEAVQPSIYTLAFMGTRGRAPKEFAYVVLLKGKKKERIQVLKKTFTDQELSQMFRLYEAALRGIKGRQFEAGSGVLHSYCDCHEYERRLKV